MKHSLLERQLRKAGFKPKDMTGKLDELLAQVAAAYEELMSRFGRTQEDVAKEVGKSRSHVANTVRLLRLPESVKGWVREGKLTAGHARSGSQPH